MKEINSLHCMTGVQTKRQTDTHTQNYSDKEIDRGKDKDKDKDRQRVSQNNRLRSYIPGEVTTTTVNGKTCCRFPR